MREELLLQITVPIYAIVIGAEMLFSYMNQRHYYTTRDTIENIYLSALNFLFDVLLRVIVLYFLDFFFRHKFFEIRNIYIYWFALLISEDFMYYWLHRIDHYCRLFWAIHVTHHSSEEFNLTVGFRSSVFQPFYRMFYFVPLALCGFHAADIMFIYAATQIWGIIIHTKTVNKLGILEWFMSTPSHHRVHHASNIKYLDRNMGMLLIVWDKLFGTFTEEDLKYENIRYGLTKNLENHSPQNVIFHEWKNIYSDVKRVPDLRSKLMYIFGPPGWSHDGSTKTSKQFRDEIDNSK